MCSVHHVSRIYIQQKCIPVGCVPPARYHTGRVSMTQTQIQTETPWTETQLDRDPHDRDCSWTETPHGQRPPWTETPPDRPLLDRDPPPGQRLPSWTETPLLDRDPPYWTETPWDRAPAGTETPRDGDPRTETEIPPPPWPDRHFWKHNLRKLGLLPVNIQVNLIPSPNGLITQYICSSTFVCASPIFL